MENLLKKLTKLDKKKRVFGAKKHNYINSPETEQNIYSFEKKIGVQLPKDYRDFLLNIGPSAGPYYGLYTIDEILNEFNDLWQEFKSEYGSAPKPFNIFPINLNDLNKAIDESNGCINIIEKKYPLDGCIPIAFQGCTFWSLLILTGDFEGKVWDVANYVGFDGQYLPARVAPSIVIDRKKKDYPEHPVIFYPPSFTNWYTGWLNHCILDIESGA